MTSCHSLALIGLLMAVPCAFHGLATVRQTPGAERAPSRQEVEKAAENGDAVAQYQLGMLLRGTGTGSEVEQVALPWLLKAARQGHVSAQYEVGRAYLDSWQKEQSYPLALKWLTRAAEKGLAEAWLALGNLHAVGGPGVLQDIARAQECYQKANEKGQSEVWSSLGGIYRWGHGGIAVDWPRSYGFYLKAAKQGHRDSQYILGQFHQYGIGTPVDLSKAVYWYTEAARREDKWAEEKLGWLHEHGIGVVKDPQQAVAWYRKSQQHNGGGTLHLWRLKDPETLKRWQSEPEQVQTTKDIEITLEPEKAEYELDELIVIAIQYRNVGKETYSFKEGHTGGFHYAFSVADEAGRGLPNPYADRRTFFGGSFMSSIHVLEPGQKLVIKKTLNQGVHIEKPGTYTISTGEWVGRGKGGAHGDGIEKLEVKGKPITLKLRPADPEKRQRDIDRLVQAYHDGKAFPEGLSLPAEHFGGRLDILRRLVFYNEPKLLPFFLDALELDHGKVLAEAGLSALPDRPAILKALEGRLDHPEKYRTLDLLNTYFYLSGFRERDFFEEPGRLDDWKREAEITRKYNNKAMQLLIGDPSHQYGYLVPGLLGGSNDQFLIEYLIRCRPSLHLVRQCAGALLKVKLGREHLPFLESLLTVERDWGVTDAAILQLVRLDRSQFMPALKARRENFSPAIFKLLLEPPEE